MRELPLTAGMVLMEAHGERVNPGSAASYLDRVAMRATDEEQARLNREYIIID